MSIARGKEDEDIFYQGVATASLLPSFWTCSAPPPQKLGFGFPRFSRSRGLLCRICRREFFSLAISYPFGGHHGDDVDNWGGEQAPQNSFDMIDEIFKTWFFFFSMELVFHPRYIFFFFLFFLL